MSAALGILLGEDHATNDLGATTMSETYDGLPESAEHGQRGTWIFKDRDSREQTITGCFLGIGSSFRPEHKNHPGAPYAPERVHCSTCRWTEVRLFRGDDGKLYVVNCGASEVPGERDLVRLAQVETAFELVETLVAKDRRTQQTVLPMPARRALAQASRHDAEVRDAYLNSPVTR